LILHGVQIPLGITGILDIASFCVQNQMNENLYLRMERESGLTCYLLRTYYLPSLTLIYLIVTLSVNSAISMLHLNTLRP
jgi:hypothetical protein